MRCNQSIRSIAVKYELFLWHVEIAILSEVSKWQFQHAILSEVLWEQVLLTVRLKPNTC